MNSPEGALWDLVWAEVRAPWCGRWRWLWRLSAVSLTVAGFVAPTEGLNAWFSLLVAVCSSVPATLCSDLLSLGFKSNTEPQREWPTRAFAARAFGRLAPFFAAETLWVGVYLLRSLLASARTPNTMDLTHTDGGLSILSPLIAWVIVFLAAGLPYAATAALLSSVFRKPKRGLVTLAAVSLGVVAASLLQYFQGGIMKSPGALPTLSEAVMLFATASLSIGMGAAMSAIGAMQALGGEAALIGRGQGFELICYSASAAFTVYALLLTVWIHLIARGRVRRHPFTPPSEVEGSTSVVGVPAPGI